MSPTKTVNVAYSSVALFGIILAIVLSVAGRISGTALMMDAVTTHGPTRLQSEVILTTGTALLMSLHLCFGLTQARARLNIALVRSVVAVTSLVFMFPFAAFTFIASVVAEGEEPVSAAAFLLLPLAIFFPLFAILMTQIIVLRARTVGLSKWAQSLLGLSVLTLGALLVHIDPLVIHS